MKRAAIGDTPSTMDYTVNDRGYRVIRTPYDGPDALLIVWRLDAKGDPNGIAGHIQRRNGGCWLALPEQKCWRSREQAVVEIAKTDQGVRFAR